MSEVRTYDFLESGVPSYLTLLLKKYGGRILKSKTSCLWGEDKLGNRCIEALTEVQCQIPKGKLEDFERELEDVKYSPKKQWELEMQAHP